MVSYDVVPRTARLWTDYGSSMARLPLLTLLRWPIEGTADEVEWNHVHGFAAGFGCRGAGSVLLEVIEEVGGHGCKWLMTVMLNLWASDSV